MTDQRDTREPEPRRPAPEQASEPDVITKLRAMCRERSGFGWLADQSVGGIDLTNGQLHEMLAAYDQERTARQSLEREIATTRKALEAALHSLDIALKGLGVRSDKVDAAMSADDRASAAMAAFGGEKP